MSSDDLDGVPDQYRAVADESDYRIPPGCPHCDKSARAYYLGDVGATDDDVFVTGWVCSACVTPITLYTKGKGGDFVDERPDLDCLDNIEAPRDDDTEQSELITDGGEDLDGEITQRRYDGEPDEWSYGDPTVGYNVPISVRRGGATRPMYREDEHMLRGHSAAYDCENCGHTQWFVTSEYVTQYNCRGCGKITFFRLQGWEDAE